MTSNFDQELRELEEAITNSENALRKETANMPADDSAGDKKMCYPHLYIVGALVPLVLAVILYFSKPKFVSKKVKGKQTALEIFDVFAGDAPFVMEKKLATKSVFEEGLAKYNIRSFEAATAAFAKVLSQHPEDRAAQLYLSNAIRYHTSGVGTDWEGIEVMDIK